MREHHARGCIGLHALRFYYYLSDNKVLTNMALIKHRNGLQILGEYLVAKNIEVMGRRLYGTENKTKEDWKNLRPMIKKRIANRSCFYPIKAMIPVAKQVLQAQSDLINGVSTLLKFIPVVACKFCPEVYVGNSGHLIRTCCGHKRLNKNHNHVWIRAKLDDVLIPVDTFHLGGRVQDVIKHDERFDFERVSAIVELCSQAGAHPDDLQLQSLNSTSSSIVDSALDGADSLSTNELKDIGQRTLKAWETLREGVQKLLLVYSAKVCKYCSEVHVGPSGHKVRLCGIFKYQGFRGTHFWEKACVDDLVPPKIVWHRRPQDPPALLDEGRNYYGRAPAVVDLCSKAGVVPPVKYFCMMKVQGSTKPPLVRISE